MKNKISKKGLVIGVISLFLFSIFITVNPGYNGAISNVRTPSSSNRVNTFYVGGNGPNNYTRIQDAIDNASSGDTVFVYDDSSPYYERLIIKKSNFILIGENRDTTIIDANYEGCPIFVGAGDVIVKGFTTLNSGNESYNDAGIHIGWWGHQDIRNCKVIGNNIINNHDGIYSLFSDNHLFEGNIISQNRNYGIYLHGGYAESVRVKIINNTIINNLGIGINIEEDPEDNIISENTIINNGLYGMFIGSSGNNIIKNKIINETYGIFVMNHNNIELNSIKGCNYGLTLYGVRNKVSKNNFFDNEYHAYFELFLPVGLYSNRWISNYWEGHESGPQKIIGKTRILAETFLITETLTAILDILTNYSMPPWLETILWKISEYLYHNYYYEPKYISIVNYDWHPTKEPYDI